MRRSIIKHIAIKAFKISSIKHVVNRMLPSATKKANVIIMIALKMRCNTTERSRKDHFLSPFNPQ